VAIRLLKERSDIAVIGMHCKFPGANNVGEYWNLIKNGRTGFAKFHDRPFYKKMSAACQAQGIDLEAASTAGLIDAPYTFDNQFFKISGREAEALDPQARLLLETSWRLLEESFIAPRELDGAKVGLFVGISSSDYLQDIILNLDNDSRIDIHHAVGNSASTTVGRIAYFYNWRGPALAVDTACSSSLVAIDNACEALQLGQTDLAVAGGVNLILSHLSSIAFMNAKMLSADAQCRPFDARANGYVRGEGCGLVLLKRFEDAVRDGDNIHAIIKAAAVNHNGFSNGITAPNPVAQAELIGSCWRNLGSHSDGVVYVEAHGTGTKLGDPIEIKALAGKIKEYGFRPVHVRSVKSNIGHLEAAAGVAGFIKTILVGKNGIIPPQCNFETLNPLLKPYSEQILLDNVAVELEKSPSALLGVSSFGFGGTNAHVLMEVPRRDMSKDKPAQMPGPLLFGVSGKTKQQLLARLDAVDRVLRKDRPDRNISLVSLVRENQFLEHLDTRTVMLANDLEGIRAGLQNARKTLLRESNDPKQLPQAIHVCCRPGNSTTALFSLYTDYDAFREMAYPEDATGSENGKFQGKFSLSAYFLLYLLLKQRIRIPLGGLSPHEWQDITATETRHCFFKSVDNARGIQDAAVNEEESVLLLQVSDELRLGNARFDNCYGRDKYQNTLITLGLLYSQGIIETLPRLVLGVPKEKILPLYPFDRRQHFHGLERPAPADVKKPTHAHLPKYREKWRLFISSSELQAVESSCVLLCEKALLQQVEQAIRTRTELADWEVLATEDFQRALSLKAPLKRIVVCLSQNDNGRVGDACWNLISLYQAVSKLPLADEIEFHCAVDVASNAGEALYASVGGFMATLALESPIRCGSAVSINNFSHSENWLALARALAHKDYPRELYAKIDSGTIAVKRLQQISEAIVEHSLPQQSGIIISGATSAIGLGLAKHLAGRKPAHMLLLGRRPPDQQMNALLSQMQETGVSATYRQCDVCDLAAVQDTLTAELDRNLKYILLHAAGTMGEEKSIAELTRASFDTVWSGKAQGFMNLTSQLSERLAAAYLFSSISSLWGLANHAPYAMANGFLKGLTLLPDGQSRAEPFKFVCHLWGVWQGSGMLTQVGDPSILEKIGLYAHDPESAFQAIERALDAPADNYLIAKLTPERVANSLTRAESLFAEILEGKHRQDTASSQKSIRLDLTKSEVVNFIVDFISLREKIDLNLPSDLTEGFYNLGLNSLAILDLKTALGVEFGIDLSANNIFNAPTIDLLSSHIVEVSKT